MILCNLLIVPHEIGPAHAIRAAHTRIGLRAATHPATATGPRSIQRKRFGWSAKMNGGWSPGQGEIREGTGYANRVMRIEGAQSVSLWFSPKI